MSTNRTAVGTDARERSGESRCIEVSDLSATGVADYARHRTDDGEELYLERRGGHTFLVTR